jgi:cell division protein FtsQ
VSVAAPGDVAVGSDAGGSPDAHPWVPARAPRRGLRRALAALSVLVPVGVACWAALGGPGTVVDGVEITGNRRVATAEVRAAVQSELGRPLLRADLEGVARRLRALPAVLDVEVTRQWPSTVRVQLRERVVLAAVPFPSGVLLVDREGVELERLATAPAGVPLVHVDLRTAGPGALRAAAAVHADLPPRLRGLVLRVGAATPDGVLLTLTDGSRVLWGSAGDPGAKAASLAGLRAAVPGARGVRYDVSAPGAPAVSTP